MRKVILGLVAITALISCKKEDGTSSDDSDKNGISNNNSNNNGSNNNGNTIIEEGTFPKEITHKDKNGIITGKDISLIEGGKVVGQIFEGYENGVFKISKRTIITYKGTFPEKIEELGKTQTYTYDLKNRLIKEVVEEGSIREENTYDYGGNNLAKMTKKITEKVLREGNLASATLRDEYLFFHNGNRITVKNKTYQELADKTKLESEPETTIYTIENGNIIKEERSSFSSKETIQFTYDNKNNPLSDNFTKILNPNYFIKFYNSKNNPLTATRIYLRDGKTEIKKTFYEYSYNNKDYPISIRRLKEENGSKVLEETVELKY